MSAPPDQAAAVSEVAWPSPPLETVSGKTLLLLRHTKTAWSEAGLYQGRSDPPLSAAGVEQAKALAGQLARILERPITILTSPLARATRTAELLGAGKPVTIDERLIELSYGAWEGQPQAQVKLRWPDMVRQWKRSPDTVLFPEGESLRDVQSRVRSLVRDIAALPGPVLAVTHDGVIRVALLEAMDRPLSAFRSIRTQPGDLTILARASGGLGLGPSVAA